MSAKVVNSKKKGVDTKDVLILISKEDVLASAPARARMSEIMLMTAAEWSGGRYLEGKYHYIFDGPLPKGDYRWALDNVFKKHDLYNIPSKTASQRMASALVEELKGLSEAREMFGTEVIRTMLDRVYARYDILGDEDGEKENGTE